jgi:hypothetical protein
VQSKKQVPFDKLRAGFRCAQNDKTLKEKGSGMATPRLMDRVRAVMRTDHYRCQVALVFTREVTECLRFQHFACTFSGPHTC